MTEEQLKADHAGSARANLNSGDMARVDQAIAPDAIDQQEPEGTDVKTHLKTVVTELRTAFPDLRFEIHETLCDGQIVACRSTMTGTHSGPRDIGPMAALPITGAKVEVLLASRPPGSPQRSARARRLGPPAAR